MKRSYLGTAIKAALLIPTAALIASPSLAQQASDEETFEVIEVRGLVSSLKRSFADKKEALVVSDGISAEDLGKFPDQNVAESLQRITGVSIDRNAGEGQLVSVRGFGPQFNLVTVNGRQIASERAGREFSFDTLAAELISGANIYKSSIAENQSGGIGSVINLQTAKPLDLDGFKAVGSVQGTYDTLSEEYTPEFSGLVSNTFLDNRLGVLASLSVQERDAQVNQADTRGFYRVDRIATNDFNAETGAGKEAFNVYVPRNLDLTSNQEERKRTSGTLVVQYAATDELTLAFDGLYSKFEVDSQVSNYANWFTPGNFRDFQVDQATETVVFWDHNSAIDPNGGGAGATDFVQQGLDRNVEIQAFGFNADWDLSDAFNANIDISTSTAEDLSGDQSRVFTVMGYPNGYTYDFTGGGELPRFSSDGISGPFTAADAGLLRSHYVERGGDEREDEITEMRADFTYTPDSDTFTRLKFGLYSQDRTKSARIFQSPQFPNCFYCGYGSDVPDELATLITPNDWFEGIPSSFFGYDVDAYLAFLESPEAIAAQTAVRNAFGAGETAEGNIAAFAALNGYTPVELGTSFVIDEEIIAAYADFVFQGDLGDVPWTVNVGFRYSETTSTASGLQDTLIDIQDNPTDGTILDQVYIEDASGQRVLSPISIENTYTNLLPSLNAKFEIQEDMLLRFAYSETLTRPTMSSMRPVTNIGTTRPDILLASGGNPNLDPFVSTNWDVSYEWYYGDASAVSIGLFSKEVDGFITNITAEEEFSLQSGVFVFDVNRPRNGETANVDGLELAWTHTHESGFGVQINATIVNSDAEIDTGSTAQTFALEGLGDSQNFILFYENHGFQARLAYNNREAFLQTLSNGDTGEPEFVDTYGQWDVSASYDINEHLGVYFEGINLTDEYTDKYGRIRSHFTEQVRTGSRYAIGLRGSF
ncbi:TonB-dependent receptor [Ningiella sp. W23]|uniref:TonB-dependent receptor n=1 Tax=Ningiella sp. W23 TaxID=3023715 RepID=UPI0037569FA0